MPITDVPDAAHMITIRVLEGLLENHTLQRLCDDSRYDWDFDRQYDSDQSQQICDALVRVFRVNKSLRHISLPTLDLRQGRMRSLLEGLGQNTTLTSLDMSNCQADAPCFALLEQSLVGKKTIPVEHIVLPRFSTAHSSGSLSTDIESFLHSIVHMRRVKAIDFCTDSWPIKNDEDRMNCLKLLLRAAKENKYIHSFGSDLDELEENDGCIELHSDIKYYLKLNRFGRLGLDSTNLRRSLWPAILAHMTTKAEDTDALFFFIREFFMRHSYPLRWQREQDMPLPKRARLDM